MIRIRWKHYICALMLMVSSPLMASTIYSSPSLNEANSLVNIVPKQAKQLATDYLNQRTLSDKTEQSPSGISRDETDSRTRTPGSTIDALRILAQADFNIGNVPGALKYLQEAKTLAQTYRLPYLLIETKLDELRLNWLIDGDAIKARDVLSKVEQEFDQIGNSQQLARGLKYNIIMLKAAIASKEGEIAIADE